MKCNVGTIDRVIRFLVGLVLIALGYLYSSWILYVIALIPLITALLRYCPLYSVVGLSTCAHHEIVKAPSEEEREIMNVEKSGEESKEESEGRSLKTGGEGAKKIVAGPTEDVVANVPDEVIERDVELLESGGERKEQRKRPARKPGPKKTKKKPRKKKINRSAKKKSKNNPKLKKTKKAKRKKR